MNNKGFTLIELIATIVIIALVSLLAYPSIRKAMASNNATSCKYYEKSLVMAAKSYIQKEGTDIIESNGGTFPTSLNITMQTLINTGYIDAYNDKNTQIQDSPNIVVKYNSATYTYTYESHIKCVSKSNTSKVVYSS